MIKLIRSTQKVVAVLIISGIAASGQTVPRRARPDTPEIQEMKNYRLSKDKLDKYEAASQNLMVLSKKDPSMKNAMSRDASAKTLDDSVKLMETKYPAAAAAIQKSGLSVHEYMIMTMALVTTTMAAGMKKSGQPLEHLPASVSPENLAFVEQNYPRIEKMLKSMTETSEQ